MSNFVIFNATGRILGNMESPNWVKASGDASLRYIEHEWVDPKTHKVVENKVVARSQAEIDAKQSLLDNNRAWMALRQQRDLTLQKTDWTQLPDAGRNRQAWATYRQALRDLPANTTDPRNPKWPKKPNE